MKYMHMIHCVCLNRAQKLLFAMCLLFSAASYDKKSDEGSNSVRMRHENSGASTVVEN